MLKNMFRSSSVDVAEARRLVAEGEAILVDVRTRREWKQGHAPEAMHVSLESLDTQMRRIPGDKTVLAICRSGNRSGRAVAMMEQAGLEARNVRGGMIAWSRAGLPVSKR